MHFPIIIGVRRSLILRLILALIHIAAVPLFFLLDWPGGLSAGGTLLLLVSGGVSWRRSFSDIEYLRLSANGGLEFRLGGDEGFHVAQLLAGATVHPALIVLHLVCEDKARVMVLLPDSASAQDRRRLRLWLRWRPEQKGTSDLG